MPSHQKSTEGAHDESQGISPDHGRGAERPGVRRLRPDGAAPARAQARRREVVVNGKRVKTVDVHAHCAVPEALALMNLKLEGRALRPDLDMASQVAVRLQAMDEQGIDVEALSINPNWYKTDRDLAKQIIKIQNEKLARRVRPIPSGSSPTPRWRCSTRILPPSSSRRP
jgi:hypothetical protein